MAANREHDVLLRSAAVAVLQAKVSEMLAQSTHPGAQLLDASQWLAVWITKPQPALGGRTPSELLDSPAGVDAVLRVLGAIESGVFL